MWLMAGLIFWILSLASVGVLIAFGVYLLVEEYYPGELNSGINAARVKYLDFLFKNKVTLTIVAVLSILLALAVIWILITKGKLISKITPLISRSF